MPYSLSLVNKPDFELGRHGTPGYKDKIQLDSAAASTSVQQACPTYSCQTAINNITSGRSPSRMQTFAINHPPASSTVGIFH